jgi:hypothetical protein
MSTDDDDDFLPVEECAQRLGLTVERVMELVSQHVLRARRYGGWLLEVQPALIDGITTERKVKTRPAKPPKPVAVKK